MIRFRCFCILEASNLFCTVENRRQLPAQIVFHKRKSQVILSLTTTSVQHPQDNGTSALNTHQLQVERRESHWANQVMVMLSWYDDHMMVWVSLIYWLIKKNPEPTISAQCALLYMRVWVVIERQRALGAELWNKICLDLPGLSPFNPPYSSIWAQHCSEPQGVE